MGDVIAIEEHLPHFVIVGPKNEPHIIPVVTVEDMAKGVLPLRHAGQEDIDDDMIRGIIGEWLEFVRE